MSRTTQVPSRVAVHFRVRGFHPLRPHFPVCSARFCFPLLTVLQPRLRRNAGGLGSCAFARHYLRNHCYFLFLRVLRCFSSPGSPGALHRTCHRQVGCPIRKSVLMRVFAPGHGLSQLVTSFVASESQGILHVPFSPFCIPFKKKIAFVTCKTSVYVFASASISLTDSSVALVQCLDSLICSFDDFSSSLPTCQCPLFLCSPWQS